MSICKIGETKVINGKRYRKDASDTDGSCNGCHFFKNGGCPFGNIGVSIEDGGSECDGAIWRLSDDQPEAPTATPPRDEVREQRRFQAAVAAMQGYCAHLHIASEEMSKVAKYAVEQADALLDNGALRLVKLERTAGQRLGRPVREVLPGSQRSRVVDAQRLADDELTRTGVKWEVVSA